MDKRNSQTIVASTNKAINKARVNGVLDLGPVALFQLIDYYIDFTQKTIDNGFDGYLESNIKLKEFLRAYTYNNPDTLCNYKITTNVNVRSAKDLSSTNTPPTVDGTIIDIEQLPAYFFTVDDFTTNYNDVDGDTYKDVLIYITGLEGSFYYNNILMTDTVQIPVREVVNLEYRRLGIEAVAESFTFRISDNAAKSMFSTAATNNITGDVVSENQPPTIGDNTIYSDNRTTTILTLDMFTNELQPPYNDPEGDLIDAIRIDEISTANKGKFYVDSIEIQVGDIILREDLAAELFVHIGADEDTISSDVINFSARDEGSQIWVQ